MVPVADTRKSARFGPGWTYITPSAWDWHEVWDGEKERTEGAWIELKKLRLLAERSNVCEPYWELGLDGEAEARVVPYIAWPAIEQLPTSNRATAWKRAEDGEGLILRGMELTGDGKDVVVALEGAQAAYLCDTHERVVEPIAVENGRVRFNARPFGLFTIRIKTA